jgi:hypothetical protein
MHFHQIVRSIGLSFVCILLGSCAASAIFRLPGYENESVQSLAVMEQSDTGSHVAVLAIDDMQISQKTGEFQRYELPPGQRKIVVQLVGIYSTPPKPLNLLVKTKAGAVYELMYAVRPTGNGRSNWRIWVADKSSRLTVSIEQ